MTRVLVTGASGLLGRAVFTNLADSGKFTVEGWALNRLYDGKYKKVDLLNLDEISAAVASFHPKVIIHCAAERRPDAVKNEPTKSDQLNVGATRCLAQLADKEDIFLLYMSTDYVFNGTRAPYQEQDKPNPLNEYGRMKLGGEMVVQGTCHNYAILRVPILYGQVEYLGEGAIDVLLKNILATDKPGVMSHYELRVPTHVDDVASAVRLMVDCHVKDPLSIHGIYHWGGDEVMTKWDMCLAIKDVFKLSLDHLTPDASKPEPGKGANRPYNATLKRGRVLALGMTNRYKFAEGIECLRPFV